MSLELIIGHLLFGPLMLAFSFYYIKYPPKEVNSLYGYRTQRSMRNQDCWEFANRYSAKLMWKTSLLTCVVQAVGILTLSAESVILSAAIVLILGLFYSIYLTEKALKNTFDKEGNRL